MEWWAKLQLHVLSCISLSLLLQHRAWLMKVLLCLVTVLSQFSESSRALESALGEHWSSVLVSESPLCIVHANGDTWPVGILML